MKSFLIVSTLSLVLATLLQAAPPPGGERVTDVTPRGFSVVWNSASFAAAGLQVFTDAADANPVANAVISPHPTASGTEVVREAAEAIGVLKASVANLTPDTTYYFRTLTTSNTSSRIP